MARQSVWRAARVLGAVLMAAGAGLVVAPPASAAPVADIGELRTAIDDRNGSDPVTNDPIELASGVTYSISGDECDGTADQEDRNESGDLDIIRAQPLEIFTAAGQPPAIIEVACADPDHERAIHLLRLRTALQNPALTLRNVVIRNGHAPDAASDGTFDGTGDGNFGGGVLAIGDVTLIDTVFENNTAGDGLPLEARDGQTDQIVIQQVDGGAGGSGGGVAAIGAVTIESSEFTGNRAGGGATGGDGPSEITSCDETDGGSGGPGGQGGAVLALGGIDVADSSFSDNHAGNGGLGGNGGGANAECLGGGAGGDGGLPGSGGAVQCGTVGDDVQACTGAMVVRASTLDGNSTGSGGNGGNGADGLDGGSGAGGDGGDGGGATEFGHGLGGAIMFVGGEDDAGAPATLLVENSTLDGNLNGNGGNGGFGGEGGNAAVTAQQPGGPGGAGGSAGGGGVAGAIAGGFEEPPEGVSVASLVHDTITDNGGGGAAGIAAAGRAGGTGSPAGTPGAPGEPGDDGGGSLLFFNPWASEATVVGTSTEGALPNCLFAADSATFSMATDDSCGFGDGGEQEFSAFALGALAANGGPTQTRLPGTGSILIDEVTDEILPVDQRGVPRPQAAGSDIGAVEVQVITLAVTKTASAASVTSGTEVTFTITVQNTGSSSPEPGVTVVDPNCTGLTLTGGDANTNDTLDPGETFTYTCKATPTAVGSYTNTATATVTDALGAPISGTASVVVQVTAPATTTTTTTTTPATGGKLPATGQDTVPLVQVALLLIVGGALLVWFHPRGRHFRRGWYDKWVTAGDGPTRAR